MSVVANVAINVDATAAERALKNLSGSTDALHRKFDTLPNRLSAGLQGLGGKLQGFGQQLTGLGSVMAGIGASAAVGGFVKAGIEADRTRKTIKALADQYGETSRLTKFATDAANRFGLGQTASAKAVADLYGRLRPMGVSLNDIQKTFIGVNNAAAKMNLTAADTDGVMLQLSQAMGSGALQGDELRSVMERLPAVGQAIAKVMGVTVGEIKQLGADGKITTDIIVKAMDELGKMQPPAPDAYRLFQKAMADLNTTIGEQLLPIFTPLVQKLGELVAKFQELGVGATIAQALLPLGQVLLSLLDAFLNLNPGIQKVIIQVGVLVGAFALIAAPLGFVIAGIGSLMSAVGTLAGVLGGLKIIGTITAALTAMGPVIGVVVGVLKGLGAAVLAVFSGPVGWIALAVAAGVAIYAFRDKIAAAFKTIGDILSMSAQGFYNVLIKPIGDWINSLVNGIINAFRSLPNAMMSTFRAVYEAITRPIKQAYDFVIGIVRGIINAVSQAVQAIANLGGGGGGGGVKTAAQGAYWSGGFQAFAKGGMVTGPTLGLIGEGGEPEYIVPQSKAAGFAENWISGKRGANAIPKFADGGVVMPSAANVNITTGPVTQMNGTNYVTTQDMGRAVQAGVQQTLALLRNDINVRRTVGIA